MISIGIASYNQQDFLPDAIESALAQNCEVIVCDDGSTDNSLKVAELYKDKIKIIAKENGGLSSARNACIEQMTGDYFLPLDSDDILLDGCIVRLEEIIKQTNADVVAPSFKEFGLSQANVVLLPNPTLEDFKTGNRIGYCAAIKKEALKEVGGYSETMKWGYEDLSLWIKLLTKGKRIITTPEILWLYRTKANSMIHQAQAHHTELLEIIKQETGIQLNF